MGCERCKKFSEWGVRVNRVFRRERGYGEEKGSIDLALTGALDL